MPVDNGVKLGDIQALTLFSLYFAVMLSYAFQGCDIGVYIRFRTSGKVFKLRSFSTTSTTSQSLARRELLFADDANLVAHTEEEMQLIMDISSQEHTLICIRSNHQPEKDQVMYTPPVR